METAVQLYADDHVRIDRRGRFVLAELLTPHAVLSTSHVNGGSRRKLTHLVNHQSCEAAGHSERFEMIMALGQAGYHKHVCRELGIPAGKTAIMGTAANMQYAACERAAYEEFAVLAVVTAGVTGNAGCAGDPSQYVERNGVYERLNQKGTINTMLFFNVELSEAALVRAVATMTEAKSAVLRELAIRSRVSDEPATGTGTDQFCLAAPITGETAITWTGKHAKMGELIGTAVRDATREALRWQNGLEPSFIRNVHHALDRFGFTRKFMLARLKETLSEEQFEFFVKNEKAVTYEPQIAGCAYALGEVFDRLRYGTLPQGAADELILNHLALLAATLAAKPSAYTKLRDTLNEFQAESPAERIFQAILAGWREKWL